MSAIRRPFAVNVSRRLATNPGRIRVAHIRNFTVTSRASNISGPAPAAAKPKKQRRIIRRTFIYSTLLVLTVYGAGTAAAVNNERIHDYFLENMPLGEQILDFAESKGYVGGLPRQTADPSFSPRRKRPTPSPGPSAEPLKKHEKIEAFKTRVEGKVKEKKEQVKEKKERIRKVAAQLPTTAEKGLPRGIIPARISDQPAAPLPPKSYSEGVEDLVKEVKSVLKGDPISLAEERREQEEITAKATPESEKSVEPAHAEPTPGPVAPVKEQGGPEAPQGKKWYTNTQLPLGFEPPPGYAIPPPKVVPKTTAGLLLVAPAVAEFTASEPLLNELATTVDNLAKYLEDNPKAERTVNKILDVAKKDLADLGSKIKSVKKESKEKLETSLAEAAQAYSVKLLEAELNARDKLDTQDEEWRHYFEQERLSLLQKYQEKLDNELATQNDLINERLKEEVIAQGIELQRRWIRDVQLHVEEERGGRLAKLEEVASGLKRLERLTLDNANYLDENLRLHAVWSALRALTNVTVDSPVRKPFRDELHVLKSVASAAGNADDAVLVAIASLEKSETPDIGLEPLADLTSWFVTSVSPRVNSVSLVPDYGGGVLIYLASSLMSTLRFKRSGLVQGNDTLSIMARAEYYLNEKDLDSATRELNQLQGPAKELLRDWLTAARRRLEVQQALEVVQSQATLSSLLVL